MIYVTSDLHGLPLKELQALLKKAGFSTADWLYILGDVVDRRNDGGVEILRWLLVQDNAQLILGNHEAMLLACDFVFEEITEESINALTADKMGLLQKYMQNGGDVTLKALRELRNRAPDLIPELFDYLHDAPLYEAVSAGGKDFLLLHSGIDHFEKDKKLSQYAQDDFLWTWTSLETDYFDEIITVFGHTPTLTYGEEYTGKILKTRTWIDIDVGAGCGQEPVLLRLDDFEEFRMV